MIRRSDAAETSSTELQEREEGGGTPMSRQESTTIPPLLNRIMSALLRSPLHVVASRSVMLITFVGRKSGRSYTIPISYAREGDLVTAFTGARWWKESERWRAGDA